MIKDLGIQVKMAFAIVVGMADTEHPGAVLVGFDLFDICGMAGRHAAPGVDIQHNDRPCPRNGGRCLVFLGTGKGR